MKRNLLIISPLLAILGQLHAATSSATKTNVIFILADDLGVGNVGC
jgi:hypothetical protein